VRAKTTRLDDVLILGLALGPLVGLVAAIAIAIEHGAIGGVNLALFFGFWFATLVGIELGYHRYFSHRAFRTGRVVEALLVIFGSMSFQGPAIWWAATHRLHHKHADRPNDPHSPHLAGGGLRGLVRGLYDAHMGWNFRAYQTIRDKAPWKHLVPDLLDNRWLRQVNRGYFAWMAVGLVLPAAIGGLATGSWHGVLTGFLWGGLVRLFAVNHAVYAVNSLCHGFGSRPFALHSRDRSTNNLPLVLVTLGASLHHNHHVFPGSASNWIAPWHVDPGGAVLRAMSWLGLVWDLGTPDAGDPAWRRRMRVRVGDRVANVSGLTEKGAFVELGLRAAEIRVGTTVKLRDFELVGAAPLAIRETEAVVDRVTWHGIAVTFAAPTPQIVESLRN
jgi:stearoyl-CoA desaturase (delta-9 desaturase)